MPNTTPLHGWVIIFRTHYGTVPKMLSDIADEATARKLAAGMLETVYVAEVIAVCAAESLRGLN